MFPMRERELALICKQGRQSLREVSAAREKG